MYNIQYFVMNPYMLPSGNTVQQQEPYSTIVRLHRKRGTNKVYQRQQTKSSHQSSYKARDDLDEVNTDLNLGVLCNLINCILALLFSNKFVYGINLD